MQKPKHKRRIFIKTIRPKFSIILLDYQQITLISKGMYLKLKKEENNISAYIRELIMRDKNIDIYGNNQK